MDFAIRLSGVSRFFGAQRAVEGIDLTVAPGELVGIVNLVSLRRTSGEARIDRKPREGPAPRGGGTQDRCRYQGAPPARRLDRDRLNDRDMRIRRGTRP